VSAPGDTARLYHRLSSVEPGWDWGVTVDHPLVLQDFDPNDRARFPAPYKAYPDGLPVTPLPRTWSPDPLGRLARLLHLSAGVVRYADSRGQRWLLRACGSAGGRYPYELYVAGFDDGVHWYDPAAHALVRVAGAPGGDAPALVVTGVPWRTGWRYAERGYRHVYWDVGTMLSHVLALSDGRLWTRFPDAQISRLVGADGVHEWPAAVVALGPGEPAVIPGGDAAVGAVDANPMEFPLVTLAQHAGDGEAWGEPWPAVPAPASDLDTVLLQRGSTRVLDRTASVPYDVFRRVMEASVAGTRVPHFVAVHAVEGLEPGIYRWPLELLRGGDQRGELLRVCMEQHLAHDAAFVVMAAADLSAVDDRGYREVQLDAGLVDGRVHIAAFASGLGASGMTFYDSEIAGLLGEPLAGLLFTCVGVPAYRNRPGGAPGEPVPITRPVRRS
jgi:hypothetical protein